MNEDEELKIAMNKMARVIKSDLPKGIDFTLMIHNSDGIISYVSSQKREEVIEALHQLLFVLKSKDN